jgi:hypothetical protein
MSRKNTFLIRYIKAYYLEVEADDYNDAISVWKDTDLSNEQAETVDITEITEHTPAGLCLGQMFY